MKVAKKLLRALDKRDGHRCAWHPEGGCDPETLVPHHRSNRGMGGDPSKDRLSNLVWLCADANGLLESDPRVAVAARLNGMKLSIHDKNPSHVPIIHAVHGRCCLNDDGTVYTGVIF